MALSRFERQVLAWQRKAEAAMEATLKEAAQDLTMQANESRFKTGNTPIDTGFLRNSFTGAVNSIPSGEDTAPKGYKNTDFDAGPALLAINSVKIGDRLVLGWTANYAIYMEARYSFMRRAAQNWDIIAANAARRVRRAIK
jgi:hypothetical protein